MPGPGIEPGRPLGPRDFKSRASASSATPALTEILRHPPGALVDSRVTGPAASSALLSSTREVSCVRVSSGRRISCSRSSGRLRSRTFPDNAQRSCQWCRTLRTGSLRVSDFRSHIHGDPRSRPFPPTIYPATIAGSREGPTTADSRLSTVLFEAGLGRNQFRRRGLDGHLGRFTEDRVAEVG